MSLLQQRALAANKDTVQNAYTQKQEQQHQQQPNKQNSSNDNNKTTEQQHVEHQQQHNHKQRNRHRNNRNRPQSAVNQQQQQQYHTKDSQQHNQPQPQQQQYQSADQSKQRHLSTNDTTDSCLLCAYSLNDRQHIGIFNCQHSGQICADCIIRTKLLMPKPKGKTNNDNNNNDEWHWSCPFCRNDWQHVIVTANYQQHNMNYNTIKVNDMIYDDYASVYYMDESAEQYFKRQYSIYCPTCNQQKHIYNKFNTIKQYETHLSQQHKLYLCSACVSTRRVYIHEQQTYTKQQLLTHFKQGSTFERRYTGPIGL